ncbi:MAG: histidine phosphatase family protein [Sulfitobacter sp.]
MRELILMRHAKSSWTHTGPTDHERPLNARGTRSAAALGEWLGSQDLAPDEVLSSSAQRTHDTYQGLDLQDTIRVSWSRDLYLAGAERMMTVLKSASGNRVLMLGHNPGIADFAARLVARPPDHTRFDDYPTGATTVIRFDVNSWSDLQWHSGDVMQFVTPRELAQ